MTIPHYASNIAPGLVAAGVCLGLGGGIVDGVDVVGLLVVGVAVGWDSFVSGVQVRDGTLESPHKFENRRFKMISNF